MKSGHMLTVLVLCFCAGCGTYVARSKNGKFFTYGEILPRCYPATYVDGALIGGSFTTQDPDISGAARCASFIGGVVDMPISVVTDTLGLPYDLSKSSETNGPPNQALQPTATAPSVSTEP